jgi:acyl-CoA synthetase (NDP forming)
MASAIGIPSYATESDAVRGFMHLVRYREALDAMMATPPSLAQDFKPDVGAARAVVEKNRRLCRGAIRAEHCEHCEPCKFTRHDVLPNPSGMRDLPV